MEIEVEGPSQVTLRCVLSIYSAAGYDEALIMRHKVDYSGKAGEGQPIDPEEVMRLLAGAKKDEGPEKELPRNFTPSFDRMLFDNSSWRVWYTLPQYRELFIAGKPTKCWLPGMVWCGHRKQPKLYLWSYSGNKRPTLDTICYRPRYGPTDGLNHIHADSRCCLGSMNPGTFTPKEWETAFYDSNFKTGDGLLRRYRVHEKHKKQGALKDLLAQRGSSD